MAGLTAAHIRAIRNAAGAYGAPIIPEQQIANLFNEAMTKYGDGQFTNKKRVAALVSECLMESAYFRTTVEYANTGPYQPYRGRTFIQLTWKSNYADFGRWCVRKGLLRKGQEDYFVRNPVALGRAEWAALGGVYYFTQKKWSGKNLCQIADSGSSLAIGRAVNLGNPWSPYTPNGQRARDRAFELVMSLPDDIVPGKKKKKAKKAKKAKPWQGYLWTVAKVKAYDGTGRHRPEFDLKPGQRIYGKVNKKKFNDGRYFQWHEQPHAIYYPLDAGGFSHKKGGKPIGPGKAKPKARSQKAKTYKVRRGDTLSKIAAKYHTTVARLAKANGIKNVNLIYVGQRLVIK